MYTSSLACHIKSVQLLPAFVTCVHSGHHNSRVQRHGLASMSLSQVKRHIHRLRFTLSIQHCCATCGLQMRHECDLLCSVVASGGSEGIGYALAELFIGQGASVTLASRSKDKLKRAQARLLAGSADVQILTCAADVGSWEQASPSGPNCNDDDFHRELSAGHPRQIPGGRNVRQEPDACCLG